MGMSRIDTQDLILGDRPNVQRIIEIGPSKVLATMAGKTLNRKFLSQDRARVVKRQLLSNSTDTKAIFYEYDEDNVAMEETSEHVPTGSTNQTTLRKPDESKPVQPTVSPPARPENAQSSAPTAHETSSSTSRSFEDVPLSATDVALALIAQKFKQAMDELPVDKTIRDLSGGESLISDRPQPTFES